MSKTLYEAPLLALDVQALLSNQASELLARQADESGPLLRWTIPFGQQAGHEAVFLIGPEANRLVMQTHRECFSHEEGWTPYIGSVMGKGLVNMDPPEHTQHRKLWNPAFTQAYIEAYLPSIQQVITERTADWAKQGEIDLYEEVRTITFQVVTSALASLGNSPQVVHLQELFFAIMGMTNPDPRDFAARFAKALRAREELDGIFLELIAQQRKLPEVAVPRDVLEMIVHARNEDGYSLTDEQILSHLKILLLAGHETTAVLSTFVLYSLATQPEQRQRIEKELRSLLSDSEELVPVATLRQMKQLDNFIKEAGRLYSPMFAVPRLVTQDVEFAGYLLPAGTFVHLALAACHHQARIFSEPEAFDPDRFASPREEDKHTPYGLVTFGGGPRQCIGVNFTSIEVKMLAAHILRFYRLETVNNQAPQQVGFIGNIIPKGFPMRVTSRVQTPV